MIKGKYKDVLNTFRGETLRDSGWRSNRIVRSSYVLLASLMKGESDVQGILYIAIGEGQKEWDSLNPPASASTQILSSELLRYQLEPAQITFIDALNQPSILPTNRLEITTDFIGQDIVESGYQSLREFGLFGGDATDAINSGRLINYVIHPRIDLTPNATLTRKLHLTFNSATELLPVVTNWLAEAPVEIIDGVGKTYANALTNVEILTISDLANADMGAVEKLPQMKFMELRAKAQLTIRSINELSPVESMMSMKFKEIFAKPITTLATELKTSLDLVDQTCNQLCNLQLALDHKFLENKTLNELIMGTKQ